MAAIFVPDFFWWVFVSFFILNIFGVPLYLHAVSKGTYNKKETSLGNACRALVSLLFIFFYFIILTNWHV